MEKNVRFWEEKSLAELSQEEWESLCDGCGKCCLIKLENADSKEILYTDIACKLLDCETCRCMNYPKRKEIVPDCVILNPDNLEQLPWMPDTCAYRLIYEGKPLPQWHPLISGDSDSVHQAGVSVRGKVVREGDIPQSEYANHVKNWNQ